MGKHQYLDPTASFVQMVLCEFIAKLHPGKVYCTQAKKQFQYLSCACINSFSTNNSPICASSCSLSCSFTLYTCLPLSHGGKEALASKTLLSFTLD